jgi:hypothetical protein
LPRWTIPEGWIPLKILDWSSGRASGAGAGTSSRAMDHECSGQPAAEAVRMDEPD